MIQFGGIISWIFFMRLGLGRMGGRLIRGTFTFQRYAFSDIGLMINIAKAKSWGSRLLKNVVVHGANRIGVSILNTSFFGYLVSRLGSVMSRKCWVGIWPPLCVISRLFALELDKEICGANKMKASSVIELLFAGHWRDGAERKHSMG
ncbi:hypothetical protein Tco_0548329 [Tanacetum coccineum]